MLQISSISRYGSTYGDYRFLRTKTPRITILSIESRKDSRLIKPAF